MPNWIKNKIIVKNETIKNKILETYEGWDEEDERVLILDFNKIIPMPETLKIECSSRASEALYVYYLLASEDVKKDMNRCPDVNKSWAEESHEERDRHIERLLENWTRMSKDGKYPADEVYKLGKTQWKNFTEYGHTNWYTWCIDNWGTKWNSCRLDTAPRGEMSALTFETAWDPALPIILELSKKFPKEPFAFLWADEDIGCHVGYMMCTNGKIDYKGTFEDGSEDALKLAKDLWELSDEEEGGTESE